MMLKKIIYFMLCISAVFCLTACSQKSKVEEKAVEIINQQLQKDFPLTAKDKLYKCVKVEFNHEIEHEDSIEWEGTAFLENGAQIPCAALVLKKNDEQVYVILNRLSGFTKQ